jgi:hypothetical protein
MNKHQRFRTSLALAIALSAGLATSVSWAGMRSISSVYVTTTNRYAAGSLGSARNSADSMQYIGCETTATDASAYVSCVARNSAGTAAYCYSTSSNLVAAARAINGDAHLSFNWNDQGECTQIRATSSSQYEPKQ